MTPVAIVVSSCDAFFDAWRPFAFFFHKFWPDCPFPVYLITNELRVDSKIIRAIPVGADRGWASNLRVALSQIAEPHLLYVQEDYFLTGHVQSEMLTADFEYAIENDADSFCLRARSELEPGFAPLTDRFGVVPPDSDGRTRLQLTLWKRDSLLAALRDGDNAWEMESQGSERTRSMKILSYSTRENVPVPYLMSAIVRGLWTPEALQMCDEAKVEITPCFRGTYSPNQFIQRWRRARTRARLKGELAKIRGGIIELD